MVLFYGVQIGHAALGGPTVRFLLLLFALLFAGYSHAATISVKSSGPNKPALVVVTGTLNIDDTNQFSAKVGRLSNATVRLQIEGGNLVTGIQIGEIIRLHSYATVVPEGWRCALAGALAWLAVMSASWKQERKSAFLGITARSPATSLALI